MKKYATLVSILLFSVLWGQKTDKPKEPTTTTTTTTIQTTVSSETNIPSIFIKKHEIKIGAVKLLAAPILEGTYEHIYSKDFTFGGSILLNINNQDFYNEEFSITPFARFYFTETKEYGAYGFFVEGFAKYFTGKTDKYSVNYNGTVYNGTGVPYKISGAAAGLCLGRKWVNNSGFVLELLAGAGRTLGASNNEIDVLFRGDINIGYRF